MKAKATKWILKRRFQGLPKSEDFEQVTETLPELKDGEVLVKAEWLTVDPYMRAWANDYVIGETMPGGQVGRVVQSKDSQYPEGTKLYGYFGWRDFTIFNPGKHQKQNPDPGLYSHYKLPDLKGLPESYALGVLGMPGNTAYFGFTKMCKPKAGETLVVSGAGGAVGSIVGQIGKKMGLKVIGITGSEEKVDWLKKELGFDEAFNYKTCDLDEELKKWFQQGGHGHGIDCYFDNVGGKMTSVVIKHMNEGGRIAVCGSISTYNLDEEDKETSSVEIEPYDDPLIQKKKIQVNPFGEKNWKKVWFQGIHQLRDWIVQGSIKVRETISHGFNTIPQAFIDMLEGKNIGKQLIKA